MESIISFLTTHWLPISAGLINFVWVYLEYKASIWLWPVGIILPIFYIAVSWNALFLGNIIVNTYYLISSIIGWIMWQRKQKHQDPQEESTASHITHVGHQELLTHIPILGLLYVPMYWILKDTSSLPIADTLATLLSFLGMIYLSRKQLEHWFCWLLANSLSVYIFYQADDKISAFVFGVNAIVSLMGYRHWRQQMKSVETKN